MCRTDKETRVTHKTLISCIKYFRSSSFDDEDICVNRSYHNNWQRTSFACVTSLPQTLDSTETLFQFKWRRVCVCVSTVNSKHFQGGSG